jgi:hypothetical protein
MQAMGVYAGKAVREADDLAVGTFLISSRDLE